MQPTEAGLRVALHEENRRSSDFKSVLASKGFIVMDVIGYGAYSHVKKAYDTERKKDVAIKIISKTSASGSLISKFMPRELDIIKQLRHRNVITFYDFIETTMRYYIVMQYCEKGSLLQLLKAKKRLSESRAWILFTQLVDAIEYIHNDGIAHRDIKCENIVLDATDTLKLIDFGFACRVTGNAANGGRRDPEKSYLSRTYCGSHAYASPELLRLQPYEPQPCDIWATGVVLYVMLCGRFPFSTSKDIRVLLRLMSEGFSIPDSVKVSAEVQNLFAHLFVPVEDRLNVGQLLRSTWMQRPPKKTTSIEENDENSPALNGINDRKRKLVNINHK